MQFAEIAFLNVSYAKTIILLSKRVKAYINRLNLVDTSLRKIIVNGREFQIPRSEKNVVQLMRHYYYFWFDFQKSRCRLKVQVMSLKNLAKEKLFE